jgi:hypothetical protein
LIVRASIRLAPEVREILDEGIVVLAMVYGKNEQADLKSPAKVSISSPATSPAGAGSS